jgi:hypothetical protein
MQNYFIRNVNIFKIPKVVIHILAFAVLEKAIDFMFKDLSSCRNVNKELEFSGLGFTKLPTTWNNYKDITLQEKSDSNEGHTAPCYGRTQWLVV